MWHGGGKAIGGLGVLKVAGVGCAAKFPVRAESVAGDGVVWEAQAGRGVLQREGSAGGSAQRAWAWGEARGGQERERHRHNNPPRSKCADARCELIGLMSSSGGWRKKKAVLRARRGPR